MVGSERGTEGSTPPVPPKEVMKLMGLKEVVARAVNLYCFVVVPITISLSLPGGTSALPSLARFLSSNGQRTLLKKELVKLEVVQD